MVRAMIPDGKFIEIFIGRSLSAIADKPVVES